MTTVEKLLAQIFERKNSIIEQVNQQTDLYRQHLASKCVIDGITPPSWLWNPNSSNSEELSKDELISKILCPYPQSSARWSFAHYPGYNNLATTGDNEEFCDRVSVENQAFCEGLNIQDDPTVPALSTDDHAECTLKCVPELDSSVTSPEDHTDERISNIYCAPDQSLAAIKRSKSRQKAFELRSSAKALVKSGLGHVNVDDVESSQFRFSLSATRQEGKNNELPQLNLEEADCTSRETGKKALEHQGSAKAAKSSLRYEHINDVESNQIRLSVSATDQAGQNDELPQSAEPCAVGGQSCEEILDEADCTSREIGKEAVEFQGSAKADKSSLRFEHINDVESRQIRLSLSATDQAGQNDELLQLAEPCAVGGQSCEEILDEADCTSREIGKEAVEHQGSAKADKSSLRFEHINDVESRQIRLSLSATDQAGQNDELLQLAEPCAVGGQSCEEMDLDEADCTSREIGKEAVEFQGSAKADKSSLRFEHINDVESRQIRLSLSATDQAGQNDELLQLAEPCAVGGQSCEEMDLDEADCTSREMGMGTFSDMIARSRSCTKVPISVKGSLILDCSSEDCKENTLSHVAKARRTESMPIPHSERADICFNFSKSVGPSDMCRHSCGDRRVDDASFPIKDKETNVCTGKITRSRTSRKRQSCSSDSSKDGNSGDDYQGIDIATTVSGYNLAPETGDGSLVKVNDPNVCNEGRDTRISISEDSRRYKERDTPPSRSSSQHNTHVDDVSDLEASSFSAKVDGGILASSSGVSAKQVGSCCKDKTDNKASPSDVDNQEMEASLVSSLPLIESRNSQGCFLKGVRTSLSSSNLFDARMPGNEQCSGNLCNQEKSAEDLQHSVLSPSNEELQVADVDQSIPEFESFIVDSQTNSGELNFASGRFRLDELNLPRGTLERASFVAEICRSASLDRPSYQFSSDFEFQENIFQSVPNSVNLEHLDLGDTFSLSSDVGKHLQTGSSSSDDYKDTVDGMPYLGSLSYSGARYGCNTRNQYASPVGKLWDRPSSYTGSSEKRLSSNPELTCFPIEEDPSISEENKTEDENAGDTQEEINSSLANHCDERKSLKDLTNQNLLVSAEEEIFNTDTVDFVSTKFSVTGAQEERLCGPRGSKYQFRNKSGVSENQTSSAGTVDVRTNQPSHISANRIKKAKESTNNSISKPNVSNKTSLKGHDQKLSLRGSMRNNIVSNVSSFIPLVQQKQAATACAGKRDVKVKALEAAEAAKRLEEKKENERKLKKEAMKLEREEKNLRQMELEKKKKEEERKKKDADMAKKRHREEEERKDKEKKRMRPDVKQRQREKEEKKRAEKAEKEKENHRSKDQQFNSKESYGEPNKQQSETARGDGVALQKAETKLTLTEVVMNHGECGTSVITGEVEKAIQSPRKEDLIAQNSLAKSYEISPYQCSDDDVEDDDELPTKKYIPSWASKNSVAMFLPLQQKLDPDVIFPIESFCSMDEVLLPRKLQQSWVAT